MFSVLCIFAAYFIYEYMNYTSNYISLMLLSVSIVMVACVVLVDISQGGDDLILGKRCWFHLSLLCLGGSLLFTALFATKEISVTFSITDLLAVMLFFLCGIVYSWDIALRPDKFALSLQLVVLWFMLRVGLSVFPYLSAFVMSIILCIGSVEALLGIVQLFNLAPAGHFMAQLTGSFVNTTSYGGYLALLFPVSLCWVLRYGMCRKTQWWNLRTLLFYTALPALALFMFILPSIINFSVWLAVMVPCIWIGWRCFSLGNILKQMKLRHSVAFTYAGIFLAVVGFVMVSGIYIAHTYPEHFSFLQYHPTFRLHPKDALASADLTAFTDITHSPYLPYRQTEVNVLLLVLFLCVQSCCFYQAYQRRMMDVCGAILAATVFMVFSFSLVRPPFLITLVLICVLSNLHPLSFQTVTIRYGGKKYTLGRKRWLPAVRLGRSGVILFAFLLVLTAYSVFYLQTDTYEYYQQWMKQTYEMKYDWKIAIE